MIVEATTLPELLTQTPREGESKPGTLPGFRILSNVKKYSSYRWLVSLKIYV